MVLCIVCTTHEASLTEGTVPVHTVRTVHIYSILPTNLCGEEGGLVPVAGLALACHAVTSGRGVETVEDGGKLADDTVLDHIDGSGTVGAYACSLCGMSYPTCGGTHGPVLLEGTVVGKEPVGVNVGGAGVIEPVASVVVEVCGVPSGGTLVALLIIFVVVEVYTSLDGEAESEVEVGLEVTVEAVVLLFTRILVHHPVGVVVERRLENPVLGVAGEEHACHGKAGASGRIVALVAGEPAALLAVVLLIVLEVDVAGHGVEVVHGVTHSTTTDAVLGLRLHIVEVGVHRQTVEELVVLTEGEGVAVVLVVLEQTTGMRVGVADVAAHLFGTTGEANAVVGGDAEAVEVADVVGTVVAEIDVAGGADASLLENLRTGQVRTVGVGLEVELVDGSFLRQVAAVGVVGDVGGIAGVLARHLGTPAVDADATGLDEVALFVEGGGNYAGTVDILDFGSDESLVHGDVRGEVHIELAFLTLLGGNHEYTVGSTRTVECGSVGTLQDVDALDVVRVDLRKCVATFGRSRCGKVHTVDLAAAGVVHRHTVDNDEGVVVTLDGLVTAEEDF